MTSKHDELVAVLRGEIVGGVYSPGAQLPSQVELARRFGVAGMTIQMALKRLEREGFIEARSRSGTFVVEKPPHLHQLALVFPFDPAAPFAEQHWSRYHQALTQSAVCFQQETGRRVLMFHGVDHHQDSEDRQRLVGYLKAQRVAGVIFANAPFMLEHTPILDLPGIPRAAFESEQLFPHVPIVTGDHAQWIGKALDHLAAQGRRRVAILDFDMGAKFRETLREALAARGMTSHRRWRQLVSMRAPEGAGLAVELLMNDRERPDALLVLDDNFVEPALTGLLDAGVKVPDDVAVVGHANFPVAPAKIQPVRLLGLDTNLLFRTCADLIDRQRRGAPVPGVTSVPMLWEEEVEAGRPPVLRGQAVGAGRHAERRKLEMTIP